MHIHTALRCVSNLCNQKVRETAYQAGFLLQGADREVVVRGMHDCWVVGRHRNGRNLYLVMEGKGEIGLAGAAELTRDFADTHFAGLF